jgi:hypothetical protein
MTVFGPATAHSVRYAVQFSLRPECDHSGSESQMARWAMNGLMLSNKNVCYPVGAQHKGILSRLWNAAAEGGPDNTGERNHSQYGAEPPERGRDGAASNADAAAKKGAGIDNA